jgi:hypothetical protein
VRPDQIDRGPGRTPAAVLGVCLTSGARLVPFDAARQRAGRIQAERARAPVRTATDVAAA